MPFRAVALCLATLAMGLPALANEADVSITGTGQQREAHCAQDANVIIEGASHDITLTGACEKVAVTGIGHKVTIEKANELIIEGTQSAVTLASPAETIGVFGDSQKLEAPLHGENAALEVGGHAHKVKTTLRSASRINVHGVQNEVSWKLENGAPRPRLTMEGHAHKVTAVK